MSYGLLQAGSAVPYTASPTMEKMHKTLAAQRNPSQDFYDTFYRHQNEQANITQFLISEIDALKAEIAELKEPKQSSTPGEKQAA